MEVKEWSYEEYPSFDMPVDGVTRIPTSGDEKGTYIYSNVEYAHINGTTLHLQVITPQTRNTKESDEVYPCIVYVQGSAWMKQNINAKLGLLARLSEKGYVIAVVEYRHSGIAPFPAQAIDTRNAIRYMKLHAKEYKADANQMFVAGDSSGGHTAFFSQLINEDENVNIYLKEFADMNIYPDVDASVKGIISLYGALSVMLEDGMPSTLNHHQPDSPEGMEMGGVDLRNNTELCRAMSVECNISENVSMPPILMFHGTKDRTINPKVSVVVYEALKKYNKDVKLYLLEGADHGGSEFFSDDVLDIIEEFLQKIISAS